jgi:hypothetical protein
MSKLVIVEKDHRIFNKIVLRGATKVYSYKNILDKFNPPGSTVL